MVKKNTIRKARKFYKAAELPIVWHEIVCHKCYGKVMAVSEEPPSAPVFHYNCAE